MIRVLYISPTGDRGGAEVVLMNILTHLDRSRFHPTVALLRDGDLVRHIREDLMLDVFTLSASRFRDVLRGGRVVGDLKRIIRQRNIDLVHSNGTGAHLYGGLAAGLCGVPSVYHLHDVPERSWTRQGLVQWAASMVPASAYVAVSRFVAERFRESNSRARELHIIHNGIAGDGSIETPLANNVRDAYGWSFDVPLAVWCGRLQRWKGTHIFLEAAARVREKLREARFLVVGGAMFGLDPGYEPELHKLAVNLGLADCLRFTGFRSDAQSLVMAADVVVHSSIRPDPFPTILLEAMMLGKPVIASAAGGPSELIEPGVSGLLVPPENPDELAIAMLRLLNDATLRQAMARAARDRVAESFTVDRMVMKLQDVYESLTRSPACANATRLCGNLG